MRTTSLLGSAVAVSLLAACSGGMTQNPDSGVVPFSTVSTTPTRSGMSPDLLKSKLLYVPSWIPNGNVEVVAYHLPLAKNPKPVDVINLNTNHIASYDALDDAGNLYVAFESEVQVYAPGAQQPSYIITDSINYPAGVAVDKRGTLYVANTYGTSYSYTGTITEYRYGSTSPSVTITGLNNPGGIALDPRGNLWIVNHGIPPYDTADFLEVKRGTTNPIVKAFDDIKLPIDIQVDEKENVYISDDVQNVVNIYGSGKSTPKQEIHPPYSTLVQTYGLCFDSAGHLFVSYIPNKSSQISAVVEYADPLRNPHAIRVITSSNGLPEVGGGCVAARP